MYTQFSHLLSLAVWQKLTNQKLKINCSDPKKGARENAYTH